MTNTLTFPMNVINLFELGYTEVLKNIYGDHQDCHTFDHALFAWFYYGDNREAGDTLRGLLEKYTRQVVRKQWEPPFKTV